MIPGIPVSTTGWAQDDRGQDAKVYLSFQLEGDAMLSNPRVAPHVVVRGYLGDGLVADFKSDREHNWTMRIYDMTLRLGGP
jgi:hypothetical protein